MLTELEMRANDEARHAHRELVERLDATLAEALECNEEFSIDNKYLKKRAEAAEAKLAKEREACAEALWDACPLDRIVNVAYVKRAQNAIRNREKSDE